MRLSGRRIDDELAEPDLAGLTWWGRIPVAGLRGWSGLGPDAMGLEEFARLADRALAGMPTWVQRAVRGIAIMVDDQPPTDWRGAGLLLGQFHGVPRTRQGGRVPGSLPDRIELYRVPILRVCRSLEEVPERVRKVLGHEIGHALGLGEARLRELGWY